METPTERSQRDQRTDVTDTHDTSERTPAICGQFISGRFICGVFGDTPETQTQTQTQEGAH